jgi:aryl-alcohol dehydrogenase-like predicted oxidoreductase
MTINPSGPRVSAIGLGCVTFGREIDETAAHRLLEHADASGIRFFDTASAYAQGASEAIIGRWLAARRAGAGPVTIATKVLPPYEPERLAVVVAASCERLGVAALDLFYLHRWEPEAESPAVLGALDALVRAGKVRALGASNYSLPQLQASLALQKQHGFEPFRVVQNNHNLAVRHVSPELRAFCAARGIAIVTYSPLGAGFLTSKHRNGVQGGSRFDVAPGHQRIYFQAEAERRLSRLESVAARTGHSQAHLALAWALHQPGVATVLVGGRTPAHLDQALAAQAFDDPALFAECDD